MVTRPRNFRPPAFGQGLAYYKHSLAARVAVPCSEVWGARERQAFGILTYHRIGPRAAGTLPPLTVTPSRFARQLEGLLERGFQPRPLSDLLRRHAAGTAIPRNAFAVVFDDAFEGIYHHAWPILRRLRIPATIFVPTSFLDSPAALPFDGWELAGSPTVPATLWRCLQSAQCLEMQDDGFIELGSHTHTHRPFAPGETAAFAADMHASLDLLRDRFQIHAPSFSLPFGHLAQGMLDVLRKLGVSCCLTTDCQLVRPDDDPFHWGRFGAEEFDTPATLAAKLNGWYSFFQNRWRQWKTRFRRPRGESPPTLPAPRHGAPSSQSRSSSSRSSQSRSS